ncbi:MAG: hypothetical protein D6703_03360 [Zetaproteobacteria bacterium]|nr:MAG: hypothetical protein D6703_03360 [Zetaproteobacteria bacterium]
MSLFSQWWPWSEQAETKTGFILALGGGGGRGLAHIGVLEVLEEHSLVPDAIIGTSIGALFGAMYAVNPSANQMKKRTLDYLRSEPFKRVNLPVIQEADRQDESWLARFVALAKQTVLYTRAATDLAILDDDALFEVADLFTDSRDFCDARIPMYVTAVEFPGGECRIFSCDENVPMDRAIAASMAIPGVFAPVEIEGHQYVDGGLASEIPAREARMLANDEQLVVAVNVGARPAKDQLPANVYGMLDWSSQIKSLYLRRYEKQYADLVVEPLVGHTQWHDFSRPDEEIAKGREAMRNVLPRLAERLRHNG